MKRSQHNIRGVQFGIEITIADTVNKDKDAPSQKYPGCTHHGLNHGIGTNLKYVQVGNRGVVMSVLHNIDDRTTRRCKRLILGERIRTWYPRKMINNLTQIGNWWK